MSHTGIIVVVICLAIYIGLLEQARAVMRQQSKPKSNIEARRNTMRGDLVALGLGIKQVQGYINGLKEEATEAAIKVATEAQTSLDRAAALKAEVETSLEKADSDTAIQICSARMDQARLYVRMARNMVEEHKAASDKDGDDDGDR